MKLLYKYLLFLSAIILYNCTDSASSKKTAWDTLPENATTIVKTDDFKEFLNQTVDDNSIATQGIAEILKGEKILNYFNPATQTLIALNEKGDFSIHTKWADSILVLDSIPNRVIETLTINKVELQKITIDDDVLYTTLKDSIYIIGSSQQQLAALTAVSIKNNPALNSIRNAITDNTAVFYKHLKFPDKKDALKYGHFWEGYRWDSSDGIFSANGILKSNDTLPSILEDFSNQIAQPITTPKAIPAAVDEFTIITFSNSALLLKTKDDTITKKGIFFQTIQEIASGSFNGNPFVVAKSLDTALSLESLESSLTENVSYRGITLYNLQDGFNNLDPKVSVLKISEDINTLFSIEEFIIGTSSIETAEEYIRDLQASMTTANNPDYMALQNVLSNAATIEFFGRNDASGTILNKTFGATSNTVSAKKGQLAVKQIIVEKNFANVVFASKEKGKSIVSNIPVQQLAEISIPQTILGMPVFFESSTSKKPELVFQDIENTLHLYNLKGKKQWTRKFDNPILGEITEVDIKRNRKKQLAFTTKEAFYVVDSNGKDVAPFPIKFKDEVTQPLSVFDYDGNRKYRFIVTQGKQVLMYNSEGKIVKGFNFKKTKNTIASPPRHIRLGSKDYLVITEENGAINFLSRTGKSRISVSEKFDINADGIQKQGSKFIFVTNKNKQVTISQSGTIKSKELVGTGESHLVSSNNTTVLLTDNILLINDKTVELPFGIYTTPQVQTSNNKTYVTVTETQENQVYVYSINGRLLEGFPVYGTSAGILNRNSSKTLQLLTLGSEKQLLVYEIN